MSELRRTLPGARDLLALAAANPRRYPCLLESVADGANARYDILFAFPNDSIALDTDGRVRDATGRDRGADFLDVLDREWSSARTSAASDLPFCGGWALFLGYELAVQVEPGLHLPPATDPEIPVALALRCPAAIIIDRVAQTTHLVAEQDRAELLDELASDLESTPEFRPMPIRGTDVVEDDPQRFLDGVARIHEHLRRGDTFQINLSREWRTHFAHTPRPADVYASLRRANPAPFAGLLQWTDSGNDDWAIASSSPERLIEVRNGIAQTRPIADRASQGTRRARHAD